MIISGHTWRVDSWYDYFFRVIVRFSRIERTFYAVDVVKTRIQLQPEVYNKVG